MHENEVMIDMSLPVRIALAGLCCLLVYLVVNGLVEAISRRSRKSKNGHVPVESASGPELQSEFRIDSDRPGTEVHWESDTGRAPRPGTSRSSSGLTALAGVGVAVLLTLGVFLSVFYLSMERRAVSRAEADQIAATRADAIAGESGLAPAESTASRSAPVADKAQTESSEAPSRPDWTRQEQTVIEEGQVPEVLFVVSSGLYASKEEARENALARASHHFAQRLTDTWPEFAGNPVIPRDLFENRAVEKSFTEKRIHSFGNYDEPMYRVYLQYRDSASVREPILDHWKQWTINMQARDYVIGFGILTVLLGVLSLGLRAVSAPAGSRKRSIAAVLTFAGAGAVGLLFLA